MRLIGDIHGDFLAYQAIIDDVVESVQVGDFGVGFGEPYPSGVGLSHRFIRGNHDDRKVCREVPNWILDGTVEFGPIGKRMYIGGAWSIDWAHRTPGRDWWDDEELNQREFEEVCKLYEAEKPAVMITHDIPMRIREQVIHNQFNGIGPTRTAFYLQEMLNYHQPKVWFHGHHHTSYVKELEGTTFIGLGINAFVDANV